MADKIINVRIQQKFDSEENWASEDPILLLGEMAVTKPSYQFKMGDGTSKWSQLTYNQIPWTSVTGRPSTMRNPNALTLQFNGVSQKAYTGADALTLNITPAAIGAAPVNGSTSLSKLASTITLGNGNACTIYQNGSTYQQKMEILDNSSAGDAVFKFSQSSDSGKTFARLMEIRDDGNVVANKFTGSLVGNSSTSSSSAKWSTARTISLTGSVTGSAKIDGSGDVTLSTTTNHTHNYAGSPSAGGNAYKVNLSRVAKDANYQPGDNTGIWEEFTNGTTYNLPSNAWYHIFTGQGSDANYNTQLALGMTANNIAYRNRNSGTWQPWQTILTSGNYNSYAPTKTGGGASGTWGISISGNSGTATKLQTARKIGNADFNGTANITLAQIGAAASSHTHNYAGSSSAGGAANTAVKLSTARSISIAGDFNGSFNFDGSANVSCNLYNYYSKSTLSNTNNYPYHRIAYLIDQNGSYTDKTTTLFISQDFNGGYFGIVRISLQTNNTGSVSSVEAKWLCRSGFNADDIQIGIYNVYGSTYADVFLKHRGTYTGTLIRNLGSGARGGVSRTWTLVNSNEVADTTTSDAKASSEVYVSIAAAGTKLHSKAYTLTVNGVDSGTTNYSNSAGSATTATSATKATQDASGNTITSSYASSASLSGNNILLKSKSGATLSTIDISVMAEIVSSSEPSGQATNGHWLKPY